jgi:glycosyltransferase involved in cell wall biosynthesis
VSTNHRVRLMRVITRLNVGGPARHVLLLSRELPSRGFDTELVSGSEGVREGILPPDHVTHTGIPSLKRAIDPISDVRTARALTELCRSTKPHIVHTHTAKAGTLGRFAARRAGVPIVVHTFHGHVLDEYFVRPVTEAFAATERYLGERTDALIAVSPSVRDFLLDLGVGEPSKWHVMPVGLDLGNLLGAAPGREESRSRLGLSLEGRAVGIVGRLVPIKDHATFLEAARRVATVRPDVFFVIAGDGESRNKLHARAEQMLGARVRFLGWVFDLPALYSALDVVVLSSRNEGTPVALIEAGAASKAVVATRVGGVPDVVRHGKTGALVHAGDADEMASEILALLDAPDRARAMGAAAREWVRDRFSAERLVQDVAALYRDLLAQRGNESPRSRSF